MRLAIVGTRTFNNYRYLDEEINKFLESIKFDTNTDDFMIVSGGKRKDGKGADTLAEIWADINQFPKLIYPPQLDKFGSPYAYYNRNEQIAKACTRGLAFWNHDSTGTGDVIERMAKHKKEYNIINYAS